MDSKVEKFEGKLLMDAGNVILKTDSKKFYPIPYPIQTSISLEAMKATAVSSYKNYIGQMVTVAGNSQGDLIYSAGIIRSYTAREPEKYSEEYWNNRVPKANVLFKARKLPGYQMHFSVDVRQMITINDSVINRDLSEHSLLVSNPDECNDDIYRIYHHSRVKEINPYFYEYDNKGFGCEFFMYPYELRQIQQGDCDDWGIELASYLISAGVPEWRVRCVVGLTYSGGGHLTVYILADDLSSWHHLNSTTPWWTVEEKGYLKLSDFPLSGDSTDEIGIKDVWFSFNHKYAWHAFETNTSENNLRKVPWMRNFEIVPLFEPSL